MEKFDFSERQAQAILEMRLQRLTGLEREKIENELAELQKEISWLRFVLGDVKEIYKIIMGELREIREKYSDERRTQLMGSDEDVEDEDLIADEKMIVMVTNTGYIKRIPIDEYRVQKRGGKGLKGMETREEDFVADLFGASTKTLLLVFTDKGKVYSCKVHRLPLGNRTSKGKSLANVVQLGPNEKAMALLPINNFTEDRHIVMLTEKGIIKKTALKEFTNLRAAGLIALTTDLEDAVLDVKLSDGTSDIFIATREGMSIRFPETDVRSMGRNARGVKAMTLAKDDAIIGMEVLEKSSTSTILTVTSKGYGKRTEIGEYRFQSRGGAGVISQKTSSKVGVVVAAKKVQTDQELILSTDIGQVIRVPINEISLLGRNTGGVRLVNLDGGGNVTGAAVVDEDRSVIPEGEGEGAPSEDLH